MQKPNKLCLLASLWVADKAKGLFAPHLEGIMEINSWQEGYLVTNSPRYLIS